MNRWHPRPPPWRLGVAIQGRQNVGLKKRNSWCVLLWSLESNAPNSIQPGEYSMGGVMEGKAYEASRSSTRTATTTVSGTSTSTTWTTTMSGTTRIVSSSETMHFPRRALLPRGFYFADILSNQKAFFRLQPELLIFVYIFYHQLFCIPKQL